ncbi:mechanosensitive ion channel domain-containing protein [Halovenus marina]|uniref:mechanosensitive ion channel domain-containing protein n=1 Tax=Halovenus marina TaxID=3396621 RepID=UPI003F544BA4
MFRQTLLTADSASVSDVISEFVDDVINAVPRLLSALIVLVLAYITIRLIRSGLRIVLENAYTPQEGLIVDLLVTVVSLFLWFGVILVVLKLLGMGDIAASLGTATGFIALGVAFALKEMIADTVAGVYLLQDHDFNEGDLVTTASVTGTITRIDLRKTRIRTDDGDLVVIANRDVEKRWTQEVSEGRTETTPESE